jgi:Uma2 family endonuclease
MSTAQISPTTADDARPPRSPPGTPVWAVASLYPLQGEWDEHDYLALETNHLVEFEDGCVEFLPMPTKTHQLLSRYLFCLLDQYVSSRKLGVVFYAPYRVRIRRAKYREPDVFFAAANRRLEERFAHGADLVVEVVSQGDASRARDLVDKRTEYAAAGIPEYWIIDPEQQTITVLTLDGSAYRTHGEFKPGDAATSVLLPGFTVEVAPCFAAAAN